MTWYDTKLNPSLMKTQLLILKTLTIWHIILQVGMHGRNDILKNKKFIGMGITGA